MPEGCYQLYPEGSKLLAHRRARGKNGGMRAFALVLVAALILFGVYEFYLKRMPTTDAGTASTQAISLTGVRMDLLQIAQAERGNLASKSKSASLDELFLSDSLSMSQTGQGGYTDWRHCECENSAAKSGWLLWRGGPKFPWSRSFRSTPGRAGPGFCW